VIAVTADVADVTVNVAPATVTEKLFPAVERVAVIETAAVPPVVAVPTAAVAIA
jgi:hypothetical protein